MKTKNHTGPGMALSSDSSAAWLLQWGGRETRAGPQSDQHLAAAETKAPSLAQLSYCSLVGGERMKQTTRVQDVDPGPCTQK